MSNSFHERKRCRKEYFDKHGHAGDKKIKCSYCKKPILEKNGHNVLSASLNIIGTICDECFGTGCNLCQEDEE